MADDKYSQRVRGKMASTGRSKKADRMRKMNSKETLRGEDHDYGAVFVEGPTSVNATDLEVGENVELGSSKPWFQGRRVVELDVLARSMNCEKCSSWLRLSDIKDEVIYGMASFLYISCPSSACQHISLVPTGKKSNGKGFDINYKVCLAMINAGMGPSHVNNFLTGCNIPPVDASTLRKKQKELAPVIIEAAEASCKEAQREELECSECSELEGSFDAGWQKRGSGWSYNSHTGHASLIGINTGKVVEFDVRTRNCSICQYYIGKNEPKPPHECNVNWTGSSKGMEPDMACSMIQRLAEDGYTVGTLHADNDATTQSRLPRSIIKKDDKTHVKKNLSKRLYGLSKNYKQLKSAKVIPYIVRCFMYTISKHQNSKQSMKTELATIVPHIFGHHEQCSPTWCTYVKDPTKFRFKHLPNGKALSGDKLREELDKLAQNYIERADRLLNLGSTQSNESFNNSVASFAPKNRFYGGTKSLKARVSSAVMQKNEGYGWLSKVNKNSLLSPGHLTILHGIRKDRRRKQIRKTQSTTNFKRKRLTIKSKKLKDNQRESVKEGDTYGGEIEVQEHIDTETIPSKMKFGGEESVVVFDLETTGLSRKSDITQLAAFDGTTVFNEYVSPREVISPKSSEITGLTFDFSCDQMYHHGKPVKSRDIQIVLLEFIEFISKKKKPILFGHNIASFDIPILMNKLRQHSLLSEFMLHIYGCIDTIKLARRKFKTKDIGNHKQQTLVTKLLGVEYDAHNACADVTSLFQLLAHFEYSEKDVFPFNSALLTDSYIPLIRASRITKLTARKLAHSGLCLKHLQLAFNRDSENGLKSILLEHGFNAKTVTCFTKHFTCTEE
ncbi:uncharacterized protein [Mytilus edulis]|uniref:Exonuclease domain-containing protein n=3 Tax=Mytilus TaxID=6548 RepID=A0A8S3V6J6_MYTED|nr:unnamed protein product [Mytilus edulis]